MGDVQTTIVTQWNGIDRRGIVNKSERNNLDSPRDIRNFVIDNNGHLFMPPAVNEFVYTFDDNNDSKILAMRYIETPRGLLVQTDQRVYWLNLPTTGHWTPSYLEVVTIANLNQDEWKIWAVSGSGKALFGWGGRGGDSNGQTWQIVSNNPVQANEIGTHQSLPSGEEGEASFSTLYKGRRFVMHRGRRVWFSELNDLNNFPSDNSFRIGGDDGGNSSIDNYGFVMGMVGWENLLLFFLSGSVWSLTGASPQNWELRQARTIVGNRIPWTLVATSIGVFTLGGQNIGAQGIYLFQGNEARLVSDEITSWVLEGDPLVKQGSLQYNNYIFMTGLEDSDRPQFLLFDLNKQLWTAFDSYTNGQIAPTPQGNFFSDGLSLYHLHRSEEYFPRAPGSSARITMGWHDESNPAGLVRFLGLKVNGKRTGSGSPTIKAIGRSSDGVTIEGPSVTIPTDSFEGLMVPLNIRGAGVEIELEITPANDDNSVLIESMQVVHSRKGEKLSRA